MDIFLLHTLIIILFNVCLLFFFLLFFLCDVFKCFSGQMH